MQDSEPDRPGQPLGQDDPAQQGIAPAAQPPQGTGAAKSSDVVNDRRPAHVIDPTPPACPAGCQSIAVVPDENIKDDTWLFLPPGTGLKGRILFIPAISGKGRNLVARTAVHNRPGVAGALAHPGLALRLGRENEPRVWVCARRPNLWERIRFQPGLTLAVAVAVITTIAAIFTATGGFLKDLQGNTSLWFVGAVFAVNLLQAVSKLYKEFSDVDAGKTALAIILVLVVAALVVVVLLSGHMPGPAQHGGTGTPSPSSSVTP
jgi:hypothetical protein